MPGTPPRPVPQSSEKKPTGPAPTATGSGPAPNPGPATGAPVEPNMNGGLDAGQAVSHPLTLSAFPYSSQGGVKMSSARRAETLSVLYKHASKLGLLKQAKNVSRQKSATVSLVSLLASDNTAVNLIKRAGVHAALRVKKAAAKVQRNLSTR